jgi:hypothetical protein
MTERVTDEEAMRPLSKYKVLQGSAERLCRFTPAGRQP